MASRILQRVNAKQTALLVCDMQEKFRNNIKYFPEIVTVTKRLVDTSKILNLPIVATEQYPKGLGHTVPELGLAELNVPTFAKTVFSMVNDDVIGILESKSVKDIVLTGIEAHVCVYHTTLDLLEKGYNVHVVVDATSSRSMTDRIFAYKSLKQAGAVLSTSETIILGLLGGSHHPNFREVQKLIMESAPDTGLLGKL
uniref:Isochorismatase domain-containing protein 1 n=1 Tax=Panagrellus redivivus TaxID=6233 RepID=A0A7E4V2M6_PANRE